MPRRLKFRPIETERQHRTRGARSRFLHADSGRIDWFATLLNNVNTVKNAGTSACDREQCNKFYLSNFIRRPRQLTLNHLNIVLLDTSASTLSAAALQQTKAVVAAINHNAYLKRERFSLVSFGNNKVTMQIPPSKPRKSLNKFLNTLAAGGGTPFKSALVFLQQLLEHRRLQQYTEYTSVYILTDGRSTDKVSDLGPNVSTTIIDIEAGPIRLKRCYNIARQWRAAYIHLDAIPYRANKMGAK